MNYREIFEGSVELRSLLKGLDELGGPLFLHGFDAHVCGLVASAVSELSGRDALVYFEDDIKARRAAQCYEGARYIAPIDRVFGKSISHSKKEESNRTETLIELSIREREPAVLFCSVACALEKYPAIDDEAGYRLVSGKDIGLSDFLNFLLDNGYEKVKFVEQKGEFSVRGGILDVFSPLNESPVRIELFGDEIQSLRTFNQYSQESTGKIDSCEIFPASGKKGSSLALESYMKEPIIFLAGATDCVERLRQMDEDFIARTTAYFLGDEELTLPVLLAQEGISLDAIGIKGGDAKVAEPRRGKTRGAVAKDAESRGGKTRGALAKDAAGGSEEAHLVGDEEIARGIAGSLRYTAEETIDRLSKEALVLTEALQKSSEDFDIKQIIHLATADLVGGTDAVLAEIERLRQSDYRIYISFFTEEKRDRFVNMMAEKELKWPYLFVDGPGIVPDGAGGSGKLGRKSADDAGAKKESGHLGDIDPRKVLSLAVSSLDKGAVFRTFRSALITETEAFATRKKTRSKSQMGVAIKAFTELNIGDYVVVDAYGIGEFRGVQQIVVDGKRRDYLRVNYADDDVLYVPVESASVVRKYVGADKEKVKVSRMGGAAWKNQVARARKNIEDIADDLIELYAKRQKSIGYAYGPDTQWQQEFDDLFPYEETPDQLKATAEIKRDMERPIPMDRLLSGDVGYGKTEVALRAVFKAVSASKQAAILVPTTVLAQQHFNNVKERFSKYPIKVEMISRFRSPSEVRQILKRLKTGEIDIIIGTHRLLSKDVVFKDLGLLVVDEEQRFGVKHKEAIKMIKENVDVLTLTATPIPRTLHMSMLGVRDMSVLEDPPAERSPVQTYVMEQSDAVVREAILREVERGGQVFYVYNRIAGIDAVAAHLAEMLPDVTIRTAHGQMGEDALEHIMLDFMDGKFDVLVSTTIIETGLDIANCNTMIVQNAENLGLAQLYQLRGRVGRSSRRGYCYIFFQKGRQLSEVQERRLRAIREFTDLGAGFKIAMRDLEIRGAGSLLGTAQSGFMDTIGYDMFSRMLSEVIQRRKGEEPERVTDTRVELKVNAYIPDNYVEDAQTRIDMYKQISAMEDGVEGLEKSFADRFGPVPEPLEDLLYVAHIKQMASHIGVEFVQGRGLDELWLRFEKGIELDRLGMMRLLGENDDIKYVMNKSEALKIENTDLGDLKSIAKSVEKVYSYLSGEDCE